MPWLSIAVILYGVCVAGGGIAGYVSKGSTASLISGGISGLVLIILGIYSKSNPRVGFLLAAIGAVGLAALFLYRYFNAPVADRSPMPAFPVIGLSVLVLILLIVGHFMKPAAPSQ